MTDTSALQRKDCPIQCLGVDPDGKTFHFLNDRVEHVALTADELGTDEGLRALFTKTESVKWARRHWPSKDMH